MKLPGGDKRRDRMARLSFVNELRARCLVSRDERRIGYSNNRLYYLYGTDGSFDNSDPDNEQGPPPGNKIYSHLQQLVSFLYAQDTTKFSVEPGVGAEKAWLDKVGVLGDYVQELWHAGNSDIYFGTGVLWSLVYGTMLLKPLWRRNGIYPYLVHPGNFGVLREDVMPGLNRQEAFVECYYLTKSQLEAELAQHPYRERILKQVNTATSPPPALSPMSMDRIMMSSTDPLNVGSGSGVIDWMSGASTQYVPRVREDIVELYELYVWDTEKGDYHVFTMADPDICIYDRPISRMFLPNQEPYIQICPNPHPDYWWGISEVERLKPLQTFRNQRMAQITHLLDLQAHPPSTSVGFPNDLSEVQYVLDSPNGFLNQPDPAGVGGQVKADRVKIELPQNLWVEIEKIDEMFDEMSGMTPITQGKGESGVRSSNHANQLARIGSSRPKQRALIIEDQLEDAATLYLKIGQRYDDKRMRDEKGELFVPDQFLQGCVVKVDAHTSSPIFSEDQQTIAFALLKNKVIDRESLLDLITVPGKKLLREKLKTKIEPAEAQAAQQQEKLQLITGKKPHAGKKDAA